MDALSLSPSRSCAGSFGRKVAKQMLFPAFFLWFAIPVPGLEAAIQGRLSAFITVTVSDIGKFIGWDVVRVGSTIEIRDATMNIAKGSDPLTLVFFAPMTSAIYANYSQRGWWRKLSLFALSIPLTFLGNWLRIFLILGLAQYGQERFAMKAYHDWAGLLVVFPTVVFGMLFFGWLIRKREPKGSRDL